MNRCEAGVAVLHEEALRLQAEVCSEDIAVAQAIERVRDVGEMKRTEEVVALFWIACV